MRFIRLLLAFTPWLAFLFIAHGSLFRLKLGLAVALALSVWMGLAKLHRGVILWAGLFFFAFASCAVFLFDNTWVIRHMGILASGTLAAATWFSIIIGKPFTLDYARDHSDPSLWNEPLFLKTNYIITSVWGVVFTINALLAMGKMSKFLLNEWEYEMLSYGLLLLTAAFTVWYPKYVDKKRKSSY